MIASRSDRCAHCEQIRPRKKYGRFCSRICERLASLIASGEATCDFCGLHPPRKRYGGPPGQNRFCSNECRIGDAAETLKFHFRHRELNRPEIEAWCVRYLAKHKAWSRKYRSEKAA